MLRALASALLVMTAFNASAMDFTHSIYGGLNVTKYKIDGIDDDDIDTKGGAEVGYSTILPFSDGFALRTGAGFVQRNSTYYAGVLLGDADVTMTYIEVPVTAFIPLGSGVVNIIAGLNLDIKADDDCEYDIGGSCKIEDAKSLMTSIVAGARFRLGGAESHHNLEALLESGITDMYKDTKMKFSHSVRYVYNF